MILNRFKCHFILRHYHIFPFFSFDQIYVLCVNIYFIFFRFVPKCHGKSQFIEITRVLIMSLELYI